MSDNELAAQLALVVVPLGTALAALLGALAAWLRSKLPSAESQANQTAMITEIKAHVEARSKLGDERHEQYEKRLDTLDSGHRAINVRLDHQERRIDGITKMIKPPEPA